jgi:hypothetical protein
MTDIIEKLQRTDGVKSVERHGDALKLKLFSRKIPGTELYEIPGDLRKTSQQIKLELDEHANNWEWNIKPKKKYRDQSLKNSEISDREPKGYNRNFYKIILK